MLFASLNHLPYQEAWRRQLEMLLDANGAGIFGIDNAGCCIFINRAGAHMLGYEPDQVVGHNMHNLVHHSHEDRHNYPEPTCAIYRAFQKGEGVRVEGEVFWRRDGSCFPVEYTSYPIHQDDRIIGAVVTYSDITERRAATRALQEAHDDLERRVARRTHALAEANSQLHQSHGTLQRLSAHLNTVREEERAHIARDIHDDLGASMAALQMNLNWLSNRLQDQPDLNRRVQDMLALTNQSLESVRRIITDLRPGVLDHLGLWAALEWLLRETERRTGLTCKLLCDEEAAAMRLGKAAEIALYRILQEALTNTVKHAQAQSVEVFVRRHGGHIEVELIDDGCGMRLPASPTSFGLLGMQERARALGAELTFSSYPQQGTSVLLRIPESSR